MDADRVEMDGRTIQSALISTDGEFRRLLGKILQEEESLISIDLEITVPFPEINDGHLEQLRQLGPTLIFLDLEDDPGMGLKFAQFLVDAAPTRRMIGVGPALSPEMLLGAMQAGISEYLPKPITPEALIEATDRIARKFGRKVEERRREPGQLLSVFSPKGGSGCTSVATNLAVGIHRLTRKRVLVVDLDLELGETALMLGVEPRFSFVDLVRNFHRVDVGLLASYIERHESGVELLSAPYHPARPEVVTGDQIRQILHFLKAHYDYILVDTSKSFSPPTLATFEQSDHVLLVTTVDLPSLRNITRCLPLLERMGSVKGDDWMRLIVNRYQPTDAITLSEVEETLGMSVYCTLSNDFDRVMQSINSGQPAVTEERSSYARDMRRLAATITGVSASVAAPRRRFGAALFRPLQRLIRPGADKRQGVTADE